MVLYLWWESTQMGIYLWYYCKYFSLHIFPNNHKISIYVFRNNCFRGHWFKSSLKWYTLSSYIYIYFRKNMQHISLNFMINYIDIFQDVSPFQKIPDWLLIWGYYINFSRTQTSTSSLLCMRDPLKCFPQFFEMSVIIKFMGFKVAVLKNITCTYVNYIINNQNNIECTTLLYFYVNKWCYYHISWNKWNGLYFFHTCVFYSSGWKIYIQSMFVNALYYFWCRVNNIIIQIWYKIQF